MAGLALTEHPSSFTWTCPKCLRQVPRRLEHCRCGGDRPADDGSERVESAQTDRVWGAVLVLICIIGAGGAWNFQRMRQGQTPGAGTSAPTSGIQAAAAEIPAPEPVSNDTALTGPLEPEPVVEKLPAPATPLARSLEDVIGAAMPAVVLIETPGNRGTGFFITADTIVTNAHVVSGNTYVGLRLASGDRGRARVSRVAPEQDLAVLRLSDGGAAPAVLPLGDMRQVRIGEEVIAIGSPFGLQNTVTRGIVSALRRSGTMMLLQTDAAINPGNSGGPIVDRHGRAIGVATMKSGNGESLGFAIAIDHVRALTDTGSALLGAASSPAPAAMVALPAPPSEADEMRADGETAYARAAAEAARRADSLDAHWERFTRSCVSERARSSGDRAWFAIWDSRFGSAAVAPSCGDFYEQLRTAADEVRRRMAEAEESARRAGVYPGVRRSIRSQYRLDWDGWDR